MTPTTTSTKRRRLIVIVGATGSGKTDLSVALAERLHAPIISTDSRQFFKGIPIGTAQPTEEQLQRVEHHFISCFDLDRDFNCGEYERVAIERLEELFEQYDTVVAVGGSGLYIKALCEGIDDLPDADKSLREELMHRLESEGLESLVEQLRTLDADYCKVADCCNPARVMRALEVCLSTGKPYSSMRKGEPKRRNFEIVKIGIDMPREELYDRINRRVDMMVEQGLEAEARSVLPYRHCNALNTVGFSEMFDYFDGKISREEAVELIKRNSRRYAKRQMTWFRRDVDVRWFSRMDIQQILEYIEAV